jgi:hypothetical protein
MHHYSEPVKADVRRWMSQPHRQSVARIAEELGTHVDNTYDWRKYCFIQGGASARIR